MELARAQHPTAVDRIHSSISAFTKLQLRVFVGDLDRRNRMQFLTRKGSGPGPQDLIGKRRANSSGFGLGLGTFI